MEITNFSMGDIIRSIRRSRGCTQDALAQAVGISVQAVSKWETGASLPDVTLLPAIADFLGISIDTLFNRESFAQTTNSPKANAPQTEEVSFPDDGRLRIVQYKGSRLISAQEAAQGEAMLLLIEPNDSELNIEIHGNARINGDIHGTVQTQSDLYISGNIHGSVNAQGDVTGTGSDRSSTPKNNPASLESIFSSVFDSMGNLFSGKSSKDNRMTAFFSGSLPDDDTIRVVQMRGRRIMNVRESSRENTIRLSVEHLSENTLNVEIYGSAQIHGNVGGNVKAYDSVNCGSVGGSVSAGDGVVCGNVNGMVSAGDSVNCGDVSGSVSAGDSVTCGEIRGNVKANTVKYRNGKSKAQDDHIHIEIKTDESCSDQNDPVHIRVNWQEQAEKMQKRLQEQSERLREQAERMKEQSKKMEETLHDRLRDIPDLSAYGGGALNILQVMNGRILSAQDADAQPIRMALDDADDLTVHIHGNAEISGDISGDVRAEGSVNCEGSIEGDVSAADNVNCESIGGDVRAGNNVTCESIEGDVTSGGDITCGTIEGDVRTDGNVHCESVEGDVTAYGSFCCEGDIEGGVYRR